MDNEQLNLEIAGRLHTRLRRFRRNNTIIKVETFKENLEKMKDYSLHAAQRMVRAKRKSKNEIASFRRLRV